MRQTIRAVVDRPSARWVLALAPLSAAVGVVMWQIAIHHPGRAAILAATAALVLAALALRHAGAARTARDERIRRVERERIAHDLHDGLTQDLAVIVAYADRLSDELGHEHPVAVAARRALRVARGAMLDLAASEQPTTLDALRAVADDVQTRHPVEIEVRGPDTPCSVPERFAADDRREVVRIAREAMVNAARHGRAQSVSVILGEPGGEILRVLDDGVGFAPGGARPRGTGLGLAQMRGRAERLGAQLVMRRRRSGGTEVNVHV